MTKVSLKEALYVFVAITYRDIKHETETPNFNIIFQNKDYQLFYDLLDNPYIREDGYKTRVTIEELEYLSPENNMDKNLPTLYINDGLLFFNLLVEIANNLAILYEKYKLNPDASYLLKLTMRRIWLRMIDSDFYNVEEFLQKQLEFIKNDLFDKYKEETYFDNLNDYFVIGKNVISNSVDEATRNMEFKIVNKNGETIHNLPHVYYGLTEDNTCYIYGVQNKFILHGVKSKLVERILYKLNKDIPNPINHPNHVYSLMLFINLLKEHNISNIIVPKYLTLDYRYHILLSDIHKSRMIYLELDKLMERINNGTASQYDLEVYNDKFHEITWSKAFIDKQDIIKYNKTVNFINLIKRMLYHFNELEIVNETDEYITLSLDRIKKLKK